MILGTAAYMSPEQAKGKAADKRSDIWAFGCVLYEMLTGTRAFQGDDVAETLAEVIKGTPDWTRLPSLAPAIRLLVQRCLEKDRRKRLGDVSAIQLLLSEPSVVFDATGDAAGSGKRQSQRLLVATAFAVTFGLVAIGWLTRAMWLPIAPVAQVTRWAVALDAGERFTNTGRQVLAVSPDGRMIAWTANSRIMLRSMESRTPRPLTERARCRDQPGVLSRRTAHRVSVGRHDPSRLGAWRYAGGARTGQWHGVRHQLDARRHLFRRAGDIRPDRADAHPALVSVGRRAHDHRRVGSQ
jgi:hypothetical protein